LNSIDDDSAIFSDKILLNKIMRKAAIITEMRDHAQAMLERYDDLLLGERRREEVFWRMVARREWHIDEEL